MAACRNYYSTRYIRLPELLVELAVARMFISLTESEARDVLEIVEARHQKASTIFSSQFAPAGWHAKIGEATLADAILDRIVHDSYIILIDGKDSMRNRKGIPGAER